MPETPLSEEIIAALMAAVLMADPALGPGVSIKVREVWPAPSEWRWIGW